VIILLVTRSLTFSLLASCETLPQHTRCKSRTLVTLSAMSSRMKCSKIIGGWCLAQSTLGAVRILTLGRGEAGLAICYMRYMRFHRDATNWAIHECGENKKNELLTDADINVC